VQVDRSGAHEAILASEVDATEVLRSCEHAIYETPFGSR
jgi:hypothetical protein